MSEPHPTKAEQVEPRFYRRCADVRFRIVDGEAVILRQAAAENLVLNEVGSSILKWLDSGCSTVEVAQQMQAVYKVSSERVAEDLPLFLRELEDAGVVEPTTDADERRAETGA